ncbi:MAG TPA: hypothetical protein VNJ02_07440 [Vicinamibacterales bacterium]|nr:hypothetical protein [Vicinamibacterales bacterium]
MKSRVLVVMPGHLSTTPRLLKVADAASEAGYQVRVVSASFLDWAVAADEMTAASRTWQWQRVEFRRGVATATYLTTGARRHVARTILRMADPAAAPWWAVTRALSRAHDELVSRALTEPFDLVVGGSVGGLGVIPEIAARAKVPFGLDLEDLHTGELDARDGGLQHDAARRVLREVLPKAAFVTTSTSLMADAYRDGFGVAPSVLHNVFSLPDYQVLDPVEGGALRLYWFSQTIGPGRGLEDAITAIGLANIDAVLTLRGRSDDTYVAGLHRLAAQAAPRARLAVEPPAAPDSMLALCAQHDIGLALETQAIPNHRVCLANKIFTYLPMGLPVVVSDTPAHRWISGQLGDAAFLYPSGQVDVFAEHLRRFASDRNRLLGARRAARQAAVKRWRWDHREERDVLLALMTRALA